MASGGVIARGAFSRTGESLFRRATSAADGSSPNSELSLRIGVERGMVATLAVAGSLLLLLSVPSFAEDRRADSTWLSLISLGLAIVMIAAVPVALVQRGEPSYVWLRCGAALYIALVVLEPFQLRTPLPIESTPWLIVLSFIAFSCLAISTQHPLRAGAGCVAVVVAFTVVYSGRVPADHLAVNAIGLAALAAGLVAGVRALRIRADLADSAERCARQSFESSRQQAASEAERVRTDALLHDTVLAALSAAAAGYDAPSQTLGMARTALDVLSQSGAEGPAPRGSVVTFQQAVAAAEREFTPLRDSVRFDFASAAAVELPSGVAEALVSSTLQALGNSIKYAGYAAIRSATATSTAEGGVRIEIADDGPGFDIAKIGPERLGVRVSIIERMLLVGAKAEIRSAPGRGTTVQLEWRPAEEVVGAGALAGVSA